MVGRNLAHYRVVEKLGAGGMGEVYRARDTKLDRDVALKLLRRGLHEDHLARSRLLREARTASALNHPHICTIHEVGEADGQAYIAMEYVEGRPLSSLIPGDGLPTETVVRYASQIADALAHAHGRGVVHRDLKSANVVITSEGRAKVLDFGLARRVERAEVEEVTQSQASLSSVGVIAGTLAYMAPEVLRGEPPDERSDVWALGVMLYEMAAGTRPFSGHTGYEMSSAILREPAPELPAHVPPGLRAVMQRCLAKVPVQRYQQASEARAALEALEPGGTLALPHIARSRRGWLAGVGVVVALLAVAMALNIGSLRNRWFGEVGSGQISSLAVLPLDNLMGDSEQEYFVDGMTEALTAELSKIGALKVIARTSVMRYKQTEKSAGEIARELGVDALIEGSVLRSGNRVRITAQLIDGGTEEHLWVQNYDRDLSDILALHSDVARAIARQIRVAITPAEETRVAHVRPVDPEAHEAYLKGRFYESKFTNEGAERSIEYFQQAIEKDPAYALPYAGLASVYTQLGSGFGPLPPTEAFPKAKAAARRALEVDDMLGEAHTRLAFVSLFYDWDWSDAEEEFKRAIELNPNNAIAHGGYGLYLAAMGRRDEAIAMHKRARELDPLSSIINADLGRQFYWAGQYEQAVRQFQKTLELDPNFPPALIWGGMACIQKGMFERAIADLEKAVSLPGSSSLAVALLGYAYGVAGERGEALEILDQLNKLPRDSYVPPAVIGIVYVGLGENDLALEWLEKAHETRDTFLIWANREPILDPLRSDPRFQDLLRRMNFPET